LEAFSGHLTYQIDELGQAQTQFNQHRVRIIADWSDKTIVVTQQIIVEPFGIWISVNCFAKEQQKG